MALKSGRVGIHPSLVDPITGMLLIDVPSDLSDLDDVGISEPSNGQVLKYNGTSGKWENGTDGPQIDDTTPASNKVYSSQKTQTELNKKLSYADNAILGAKNMFGGKFTGATSNGIVYSVNSDDSVSAVGTVGSQYTFAQLMSSKFTLKKGSYILSKNPVPRANYTGTALALYSYTASGVLVSLVSDTEAGFTINTDQECDLRLICYVTGNQYDTVFYPMIRLATDTDSTYQPHAKTNIQLTNDKAEKSDLTNINITGTTNTTGSTIASGTYFYLNGTLVSAKTSIANGATLTKDTNYEVVTAGALNEINILSENVNITIPSSNSQGVLALSATKPGYKIVNVVLNYNSDAFYLVRQDNILPLPSFSNNDVNIFLFGPTAPASDRSLSFSVFYKKA